MMLYRPFRPAGSSSVPPSTSLSVSFGKGSPLSSLAAIDFLRSSFILDLMSAISFAAADLPIRSDLAEAHERAWAAVARSGTWLTGERRVAVAAEIRHALNCALCARIKAALSPNAVQGTHETL